MLAKTFLWLATLALATAGPVRRRQSCKPKTPTLPSTGNGAQLPEPPADLVLKHIALGHGIQNYTCATANSSTATGALAVLYDATPLFPSTGPESLPNIDAFNALAGKAVNGAPLPLKSNGKSAFGAAAEAPFPNSPAPALTLPDVGKPLPSLGEHFFNDKGVPTFVLGGGAELFQGKKLDGIKPPTSADSGPEKTGAVDWLQLGDAGGSKGVSLVYRVVTAGGVAHKCTTAGTTDSVPYAAYYWFFGPK